MMKRNALIVAFAAALLLIGTGCDTIVTLDKPNVTREAINSGAALRLTWTAVTDAESYKISYNGKDTTIAGTSIDISEPTAEIKVRAVNGNDESDPATIDCKVVETSSMVLYGISDPDPNHPSGLAFTASGAASAMSLDDANKASLDFVCEDVQITPVAFVNAGDYGWTQNSKVNTLMDAGTTDYDAFDEAAASGYISQLAIATNGVYALWLSNSTAWSTSDHFCKAKIVSVEDISGTQKVTLNVAYQTIGGLRWLVN